MIRVYTDGAYSGKQDKGGWAFWVPVRRLVMWGAAEVTTNNQMELQAIACAISWMLNENPEGDNVIITDSMYCIGVCMARREYETNWDRISRIRWMIGEIASAGGSVTFEWVKGHSADRDNALVDYYATAARDGTARSLALACRRA